MNRHLYYEHIKQVLRWNGYIIGKGMRESEIAATQDFYEIVFPPDLKNLLMSFMPIGENFYEWNDYSSQNVEYIKSMLYWPIHGVLFDVERNNLWLKAWGGKPNKLNRQIEHVRKYMERVPKLIPIYAHRYISSVPDEAGNPVYSVYQTDIIFYGKDIWDYFEVEFNEKDQQDIEFDKIKQIPFWHELITNIDKM